MKIIAIRVGKEPVVEDIEKGLAALQKFVGGNIEGLAPVHDDDGGGIGLIFHDEGKLEGLPMNRALRFEDGRIYDIVCGKFLVSRFNDEGESCDVTDEDVAKYCGEFSLARSGSQSLVGAKFYTDE